ncbi:Protein Star [Orchesella cincta]|uniref:Protein Star n=1 Tax=Orchesella cincta TaxID=48709 RepID=A0A1D2MMB3_ORCCI|nr:Protein Star [Orchesella cincta]
MKTFHLRSDRCSIFDFSFKLYMFMLIFIGTGTIFVGLLKLNPEDFRFNYNGHNGANQYSNLEGGNPNSDEALSYFLSMEQKLDTLDQDDKGLSDFKNGTFIDASCTDMRDVLLTSPTLGLEKKLSWQGIVIACNPFTVPSIKLNRRNAWIADVCLSRKSTPHRMHMTCNAGVHQHNEKTSESIPHSRSSLFQLMKPSAKVNHPPQGNTQMESVEVQTIPLFSIVSAIGWKEVDFLSLEMKGYEMDILKNIPFDKVTFKVIQVGIFTYTEKELVELDDYLEMFDYMLFKDRVQQKYRIYVHMSIYEKVYENIKAYASLVT